MSIAFVFSGQGAQYDGMGKDLYENYPEVKKIFDKASKIIDVDVAELCFKKDERLHWTPFTQPAILTLSHAIEQLVRRSGLHPDQVAGLSLGEYTALVSSGALTFEEAVNLVHKRGRYMDQAVPEGEGAMAAVMGLDADTVETICDEVTVKSYVQPANYNMPGQIVIAGEKEGVAIASDKLENAGAKRVIPLNVSGPFHTKLLEPAAGNLKRDIAKMNFKELEIPVYSNTTGKQYQNKEMIPSLLVKQVMSPVRFEQMIQQMIEDGATTFIEMGPGKTLRTFIKKIDRKVTVKNIENSKQLNDVLEAIGTSNK